jgi:predicted O-linked N-acetylglucosamine transferase (SPINDLY family)
MSNPGADAANQRGLDLVAKGRLTEAIGAFDRAIKLNPKNAGYFVNLANVKIQCGNFEDAIGTLRSGISVDPSQPWLHGNLARVLQRLGRIDETLAAARDAVRLAPGEVEFRLMLAYALQGAGEVEAALLECREALRLGSTNATVAHTLAFLANFVPALGPGEVFDLTREAAAHLTTSEPPSVPPHPNDRDPNRRLRIGYVSPMFFRQAEAFFLLPLLEHHNHNDFEIYCFSNTRQPDALTDRHRRACDHWHEIRNLDDVNAAALVRDQQIDILVDLAMHLSDNRLGLFTLRPAPVQMTWLAYPGTTGLAAIDYRVTDPVIDPPPASGAALKEYYSERSLRLPESWLCYDPLIDIPPRPPTTRDAIAFGSLNTPTKLNEPLLRVWGKILQRVPNSRLAMQAHSDHQRQIVQRVFGEMGIARERVGFTPGRGREQYLRLYDLVDIALDTLPYNGITTTCDALWMGVPVITMKGKTAAGRAATSLLSACGLPELIAESESEFIEIAAKLAGDLPRLREYHASLRKRITESVVMDGKRFARGMERLYRTAWQEWCAGRPT